MGITILKTYTICRKIELEILFLVKMSNWNQRYDMTTENFLKFSQSGKKLYFPNKHFLFSAVQVASFFFQHDAFDFFSSKQREKHMNKKIFIEFQKEKRRSVTKTVRIIKGMNGLKERKKKLCR